MQIRTRVSHLQSDGRAERQRYIEGKKRRTLSLEATLFRGVKSNAFGPQYFGLALYSWYSNRAPWRPMRDRLSTVEGLCPAPCGYMRFSCDV